MRLLRSSTASGLTLITTLALGALSVPPAVAAPPSNDTIAGAITVVLGTSEMTDTTEATTDSVDAQANETCGAPATDASVWYSLSVPADTGVVVDVSASDFSAGVLVAVGTPGALETVTCGPGTVAFSATAGTTYSIVAFDDQQDGAGHGGQLSISFNAAPPPPVVEVNVAPRNTFNSRTGIVTLHGTYTCTNANFIEITGQVTQSVGRVATVRGALSVSEAQTCDGTTHQWTATVVPESGKFAGGKALTVAFWFACGRFECANGFTEQTVRLSGERKK